MQLEYFCVAELASIDQETNQLSLFNIIEEIGAPKFPVMMPQLAVVGLLIVAPEDYDKKWEAGLSLYRPGEPGADTFTVPLVIKGGARRHRIVQRVLGLPLKEPGELRVELTLNGDHLATHTAMVRLPTEIELARFAQAQQPG